MKVPATPFDSIPKLTNAGDYYRVCSSPTLSEVRHPRFEFDQTSGEPDSLYVLHTDNGTFKDELFIIEVRHKHTFKTEWAILPNTMPVVYGQIVSELSDAMQIALEWADSGLIAAINANRPSVDEVAANLAGMIESGTLDDLEVPPSVWAGDIK